MEKYDLVFVTNLASFYKINLYNEIAKDAKIFVIFISKTSNCRNKDFFLGEKKFEYLYLNEDCYEERNSVKNALILFKILLNIKYKKIIIGGWDSIENWTAWLFTKKNKNCVVVESSEIESTSKGIKGIIKKIFMNRISLGLASGKSQYNLLRNIGYNGKILKTKGVGIFDYNKENVKEKIRENIKENIKEFIYVGRLSKEKNIEQLIRVFNKFSNLNLNIVGYGPLEKELKKISNSNIKFLGKIDNKNLSKVYQENDVFVLSSKSEPWGLVVEEALYNGLPVILSDKVGCANEIMENENIGLIYKCEDDIKLEEAILKILNKDFYNKMREQVKILDFEKIKKDQVNAYKIY